MKRFLLFGGLLGAVAFSCCAQTRTSQDSLRLERLPKGEGEIKLNPKALQELERNFLGAPKAAASKPWMDFDASLPVVPKVPAKKVVLTLHPYTANTPYNWDPIRQKKIDIDKDTWRGDPFYALKVLKIPANWAKRPLDAGLRESVEQIEATGMRYQTTERANNRPVGSWQGASGGVGIGGLDLMKPFTREFWDFKGRKRRARTMEVLRSYGDSITVREK